MKKNVTLPMQAREGMSFLRDVPRATPLGHPSEKQYLPSLGWEESPILTTVPASGQATSIWMEELHFFGHPAQS